MPLQVQEVEKADVPLLEPLRVEAFQTNPIEPFLFPRTQQAISADEISKKERERAERVIKEWEASPFMKIFKVIDTDLDNEMIAFAMFLVYRNDEEAKEIKIRHADEIESLFGDRVNLEVARDFLGRLWEVKARVVGKTPHVQLMQLATSPRHQRRGAGQLLVQRGAKLADSLHLKSFLEASETGEKLYKKMGYTEVEVLEFDIRKWGGDVDPQRMKFMQREPRH
ncbi:unnamed protein product [Clonostachys byssicola]|uniref:N-acetyltransferase domain-containing protein n=1 Tax=Clonostachys byssicola TaxID=160290 RepID=A0A9N9USJ7_9HYPO|nr:unnamed protein product [Clonostachys byssicola]